jgi:hypothetical protein
MISCNCSRRSHHIALFRPTFILLFCDLPRGQSSRTENLKQISHFSTKTTAELRHHTRSARDSTCICMQCQCVSAWVERVASGGRLLPGDSSSGRLVEMCKSDLGFLTKWENKNDGHGKLFTWFCLVFYAPLLAGNCPCGRQIVYAIFFLTIVYAINETRPVTLTGISYC